jgi:hypothetical protein
MSELKSVNVPKFDELSVKNIFPLIRQDAEVMKYFPDEYPKGREPDRTYTFNVLNTMRNQYVQDIIKHAHNIRNSA